MPVTIIKDRTSDGTPTLAEDEQTKLVVPSVNAWFGDKTQGTGFLYVTTKNVIWLPPLPQDGFSINFQFISIHAVSRDTTSFYSPCLYCQLDMDEADIAEDNFHELRFVPPNTQEQLELLYNVFSECAALNPDLSEEGDEDGFFWNGDPENDAMADQLEMQLQMQQGMETLGGSNIDMYQALDEEAEKYDDADDNGMESE